MRNVITGGSGFLGQHLARKLMGNGERVRVFDIRPPKELLTEKHHAPIDFVQGSVTDRKLLHCALADADSVFHMAANAHLWAENKNAYEEINYEGTCNALDAAIAAGVGRFVHTSSFTTLIGSSRGRQIDPVDESCLIPPEELLGPYPKSKRMAELKVLEATKRGLNVVIGLPTMPIGPGDTGLTGPTKMMLDYLCGKTPAFLNARMNLIDVRDLAEAHIQLRSKGEMGERYILGGPNFWLGDILKILEKVSGRKMPRIHVPYQLAYSVALIDEWLADNLIHKMPTAPLTGVRIAGRQLDFQTAKAERTIDLSVRSLEDSLRDLVAWFAENNFLKK